MNVLTKSYRDSLLESLQDPAEAAAYLDAALEDEDSRVFLLALRDVAEARGISQVAAEADLNRESLYRMLSEEGNPRLSSLEAVLRAFGLRLAKDFGLKLIDQGKAGGLYAGFGRALYVPGAHSIRRIRAPVCLQLASGQNLLFRGGVP
jgi:probable addiction module antidote protein